MRDEETCYYRFRADGLDIWREGKGDGDLKLFLILMVVIKLNLCMYVLLVALILIQHYLFLLKKDIYLVDGIMIRTSMIK